MKIENVRVYGLEESIIASGYPMQTELDVNSACSYQTENLSYWLNNGLLEFILNQEKPEWNDNYNRRFPNKIQLKESHASIITTDNYGNKTNEYEVDYEDLEDIINFKWSVSGDGYAVNNKSGLLLHRLIAKAKDDEFVDHIDRNIRNNKKSNLRITDNQNNVRNSNISKNNTSGIIGISFREDRNKWRAYITIDRKQISLGLYESKEDAIYARLQGELEYFGEYAPQQHLFNRYGLEPSKINNIDNISIKPNLYEAVKHYKRICKLGRVDSGTGHDSALKGVIVQADITAPQYFWLQFERYHFQDTISSQSTMHRILKMDLNKQMNKYVEPLIIEKLKDLIALYEDYNYYMEEGIVGHPYNQGKEDLFQRIISNIPEGIELTRRITTNYLQLKSMLSQRKSHKILEWREIFCPWILTLPHFKELVLKGE